MIGRVRGMLVAKGGETVVVDVHGVGYEVAVTPRAVTELPSIGEEVVLHTHLHVREDQLVLFGFTADDERDLFRVLLGASGLGPKLAQAILATLRPVELRRAVLADDTATLELVPGVGKRSAQKLVLELRPRLALPEGDLPAEPSSRAAEVRQALEGLGYQAVEIREVVAGLPDEGRVEDLLRRALQQLGRR
ncbi:MAG: Holliday junction branch migration protein RuvA [Acidimicrobiia bacterium]